MATETLVYSGAIVVTKCWCGIRHGVPQELYNFTKRQHDNGKKQTGIYCPLGHSWIHAGKGEAERLREEQERLQRVIDSKERSLEIVREQRDHAQRQRAAAKGQLTKVKKRVANGVCPCCNRTFADLQRHMTTKHPDYAEPSS